jgi:O-succinylbenzoate synthase
MKVESIELFHVRMPLLRPFETSFGRQEFHEAVLVKLGAGGESGWGEAPASSGPWYSGEDAWTAWHMIEDFLAPAVLGVDLAHPSELFDRFRFVRGNPMAKAGVEMAAWDCFARLRGEPLARLWGGVRQEIPTGISLGIESSIDALLERVGWAVSRGYRRVKVKIRPGWDREPISAVRRAFAELPLMVDANAAYRLRDADRLAELDDLDLTMIEQPLDHDDLLDHAKLARRIRTPICLDESIRSAEDGRRAAEIGACRIVNIKQARVGGPSEAIRLHDACRDAGMPVWCGGLLETGIGRLHNVALATLPNFSLPGDISGSDRYYEEDLIDPPVQVTSEGLIRVPQGPGLGHRVDLDRVRKFSLKTKLSRF